MHSKTRASLAALATLLLSSAGAFAADLNNGSFKDTGGYQPMNQGRPALFYMRGDFIASSNNFGTITEAPNYTESNTHITSNRAWGGGVGMHFTPNIRGDLTLDMSNAASINGDVTNGGATVQGTRHFGVKRLVGLANLYYDVDTNTRFTPYIGVGLGFARNTTTAGDIAIAGCPGTCSATMDSATKTNAAGALMAGFTTKLAERWSLDAGYRFLYTGDAHTSDIAITRTPPVAGAPNSTPAIIVRDLYEHELRVGVRMDLR